MVLSVAGVSKQFGVDIVVEDISFQIERREKVALVGRNGTGKTTLLKIITGQLEPDKGSVTVARGAKIGYLRQEHSVSRDRTVLKEAEAAVEHLIEIKDRLAELEAIMEQGASQADLDEYAMLSEHFSDAEGYALENDVRTVLKRMGFEESDFDRPTTSLSGGEKTRLAIARLLLEEPELLILDEPTNHLDLQATEWLENWIRNYHGAVLIVSHDRAFLESTVGRVLELRGHHLKSYSGNFKQYLVLRAEDLERQADMAAKQARQIAALDEYVRRFMNSQRTAQARGRLKMKTRLEESQTFAPEKEKGIRAEFSKVARSGDIALECKNLAVGFPDETLFDGFDWVVQWQDRWGVIGDNGAGKSTLIRTLLGKHKPLAGTKRLGSNIALGYFSQDTGELDPEKSPLDHMIWECGMDAGPARDLLGRFLFTGDEVFRPIKFLSGGEKNKLVLATLMEAQPNLLVLDEPTNHLDMDSREALADVLSDYSGTLVLISHDRWLLSKVANRILDVKRSGPVQFPGSFEEYRHHLNRGLRPTNSTTNVKVVHHPMEPTLSPRELSKEITRMRKVIEDREEEIAAAEAKIAELESRLAAPDSSADITALSIDHHEAKAQLDSLMADWESDHALLQELLDQQAG